MKFNVLPFSGKLLAVKVSPLGNGRMTAGVPVIIKPEHQAVTRENGLEVLQADLDISENQILAQNSEINRKGWVSVIMNRDRLWILVFHILYCVIYSL